MYWRTLVGVPAKQKESKRLVIRGNQISSVVFERVGVRIMRDFILLYVKPMEKRCYRICFVGLWRGLLLFPDDCRDRIDEFF